MQHESEKSIRPVRTFVVRGGRLTPSQQQAMERLWPRYGLEAGMEVFDRENIFARQAPLVLEIGFGMGGSLVEMAKKNPDQDFIGIDVHPPGIGTILKDIDQQGLTNLKVMQGDAVTILEQQFSDEGLDKIQIFFPDPWHKKRHHKRRMIQDDFVALIGRKLVMGGILHLATDWQNYAEQMMEVLSANGHYKNCAGTNQFAVNTGRPETKFERRGQRLGHGVWDLVFEKVT